jgi:TatD DNase family protein
MAPENPNSKKAPPKGLGGFFKQLTDSIDDVVNEVKSDIKAMTPPSDTEDGKKAAQIAAKHNATMGIVFGSTSGVGEEILDSDVPPLPPEPDANRPEATTKPQPLGLPPGNLWEALTNAQFSTRMRTDACYHALTMADIEGYRRAVAAETVAPFTMGIVGIVLQAPLEEELEEGGSVVAEDMLLLTLLKALDEPRVYGAIGAGPRQVWPSMDALDEALTNLLNSNPKLIALGPIGIDEPFAPYKLESQKEQLGVQLDIAADFGLPVILTHRQSLQHVADVLAQAEHLPPIIWLDVIANEQEAALVAQYGMYAVLRPEITTPDFPQSHLYRNIPANKRLLASGSALVAPHGFSGHFNQPKFLKNTIESATRMLFAPERDLTQGTNINLAKLFQTKS